MSAHPLSYQAISTGIAIMYQGMARKAAADIREDPDTPIQAHHLKAFREAADRRDEPGGGGDGMMHSIIHALAMRLEVIQGNAGNPGFNVSRTEQRAMRFLQNLALERDLLSGTPIPLTAADQRREKLRANAMFRASQRRIERAIQRDAYREIERETIKQARDERRLELQAQAEQESEQPDTAASPQSLTAAS